MGSTRRRFDGSKGPCVLKAVLMDADGLDAPMGNPSAANRVQAKPTFIAVPDPDRTVIVRRDDLMEPRRQRG